MLNQSVLIIALLGVCLSVFCITMWITVSTDLFFTKYRDDICFFPLLLPLSPVIVKFGVLLYPTMSWSHRERIQVILNRSGFSAVLPQTFYASQVILGGILSMSLMILLHFLQLGIGSIAFLAAASLWVIGYMIPARRLKMLQKRHRHEFMQQWPDFMDLLVICIYAGLGFDSALRMTVGSFPLGAVKQEWNRYLDDLRMGVSKQDAMKYLSSRVQLKPVLHFVDSLSFSEKCGSSLVKHLQQQSSQLRTHQTILMEEHALKAPVKMLLPLSICFFPCTFLVISYPIVKQLIGHA